MFINNTAEKFYFYKLKTNKTDNSQYWQLARIFETKESLISFLASSINTHNSSLPYHWTSEYFDEINVTGTNEYAFNSLTYSKNPFTGSVIILTNSHRGFRPYLFLNEAGKHVDIRNFKDEVFKRVYANLSNLVSEDCCYYSRKSKHQGQAYHHCLHCRTNSHLYTRLLHSQDEEFEDNNGNIIEWKTKPKDREAKFKWRDDFWRKGETGWKTHKNEKQWMHRLEK